MGWRAPLLPVSLCFEAARVRRRGAIAAMSAAADCRSVSRETLAGAPIRFHVGRWFRDKGLRDIDVLMLESGAPGPSAFERILELRHP